MKTPRMVVGAVVVGIVAMSATSWAALNNNGQKGLIRTLKAQTHGKGKLNIVAGVNFAQGSDYVQGPVTSSGLSDNPVDALNGSVVGITEPAKMLSGNISASIGLFSFWDLALSMPIYADWAGFGGLTDAGHGDLEISTKLRQPPIADILFQSYFLAVTAPFGRKNVGLFPRHAYYYDDKGQTDYNPAENFYSYDNPSVKGMMLWTLDLGKSGLKFPLTINLNVGGVLTTDWEKRNTALGGFGIDYTPVHFLTIFADFNAEARWSSFAADVDFRRDPMFISPGIKITTPAGLYLTLAGDFCLSSKKPAARYNWKQNTGNADYRYSTLAVPTFGVQAALGWSGFLTIQDDDHDGLKNDEDRCPKDPEDVDGFEDSDGCPDPDNDSDGIPDSLDECPNQPEDQEGFNDTDGCPDMDNDGDGIADEKDQCPKLAEDFDGYQDKDGCPDEDNDKDGIPDSLDKCPSDPEDFDKFQDDDGCPDVDNDKDGIPDLKDKCPNKPETFNGKDDKDGCPDEKKKASKMPKHQVVRGVKFRSGSAEMSFDSYRFLEPVIKEMKEYPEIEIEVRGHTDSIGKYSSNMRLSQMRAESVRQYLISQGIDPKRIRAVGYGSSSPIADNRTAAGRAQNRRIEIVRIK